MTSTGRGRGIEAGPTGASLRHHQLSARAARTLAKLAENETLPWSDASAQFERLFRSGFVEMCGSTLTASRARITPAGRAMLEQIPSHRGKLHSLGG